jgi:hypothetical protein
MSTMTGRKGVVTKQVQQNAGDRDTQARALSFRASQRGGVVVNGDFNWIANFIWAIVDDVLRDLYVRGKYRDVILPMTVLRRLDAVLEPTKKRYWTLRLISIRPGLRIKRQRCEQRLVRAFTTPRSSRCTTCAAEEASSS